MTFYNLARMYTTTTGDSDVTLTTAVPGCLTFALAGVSDSEELHYGLITYDTVTHRPIGSEAGIGKYISSGTVFQRNTIEKSTDSDNSAIDLTGLTEIYLCPIASDFNHVMNFAFIDSQSMSAAPPSALGNIKFNSPTYNVDNVIASVDSDDIHLEMGIYSIEGNLSINLSDPSTDDGFIYISVIDNGTTHDPQFYFPIPVSTDTDEKTFHFNKTSIFSSSSGTLNIQFSNHTSANITPMIYDCKIVRVKDL